MFWDTLVLVCDRLWMKRRFSALSASGVGIGAGSLLFLSTLTSSAAATVQDRLNTLGARTITISTRISPAGGVTPMSLADAALLRFAVPAIGEAAPLFQFKTPIQICGAETAAIVIAAGPMQHRLRSHRALNGRLITSMDVDRRAPVVVVSRALGRTARCVEPFRTSLLMLGATFKVVGVASAPAGGSDDQESVVYVPFTSLESRFLGQMSGGVSISAEVKPHLSVEFAVQSVKRFLRGRHHLGDGDSDDFDIKTRTDLSSSVLQASTLVSRLLWAIAVWSMLIAGIGITNSVLTSVVERTPWIGLQRAVGATKRHVRMEYLLEATIVSATGAIGGIMVGLTAATIVGRGASLLVRPDWHQVASALVGSLILGGLAGVGPAMRAASIPPAEAMRAE